MKQRLAVGEQAARMQLHIPASRRDDQAQRQLKQTADGGGQRHTLCAHPRRAEEPENEHGVQKDVQQEGGRVDRGGDGHTADAAQHREIDLGHAPAEIGNPHNAQIVRADGDQFGVMREDAHHPVRNRKGGECRQRRDQKREAQRNALDRLDRAHVALSVILRAQHGRARAQAVIDHEQNHGILPGQRNRRDMGLSHEIEHDDVGRCHRRAQQVLQDDRPGQCPDARVQCPV